METAMRRHDADPAPDPLALRSLRHRLARGRVRAVVGRAGSADEGAAVEALRALPRCAKGAARALARLGRRPGVVRAARGAVVVTRTACDVTPMDEGTALFTERGLVCTRLAVRQAQRSDAALVGLAEAVDAEAAPLRALARGGMMKARGDACLAARARGARAGGLDRSPGAPACNDQVAETAVPAVPARSVRGESEVKPFVWWQWHRTQTPATRGTAA
jgi:hypothetical protein